VSSQNTAATDSAFPELDSVFAVKLPPRPYPGLRPFEKDEWAIFFGRERMADAVVARVIEKRVLVVHGDSGCGKSSLVRAGVLPRLEQENARGGIRWRTCATTPGESPLWNLAEELAALTGGPAHEQKAVEIRRVLNFGRSAPAALSELLRQDPTDHVCILIDQFEELFAHAARHGSDEARLVTEFLIALQAEPPEGLYAVLTMRSEFLGACARFDGFAEMVNATQYLLPRMRHADLLRAIREPAALFDGQITRELAERLIADAGGGQDELPLIQHGLMLLHRDQARSVAGASGSWRLGLEHYNANRGLQGLLSDHADALTLDTQRKYLKSERASRAIEDLFRALTDINADGQAIRRPRTLAQLEAVTGVDEPTLRHVVDAFRAEGVSFLRPYGTAPVDRDTLIDISHEALIRCWEKIADPKDGWLMREFRNGLVWRALLVQADSFERDPKNVLAPTTTDEREQWLRRRNASWAQRYGGGWERVQTLVAASGEARDRGRAEEAKRHQREEESRLREQRSRLVLRASGLLLLLLIAAIYFAVKAKREESLTKRALAISTAETARAQREFYEAQVQFENANAARARAEALAAQARESAEELRQLAKRLPAGPASGGAYAQTSRTAQSIEQVAEQLSKAPQTAATTSSTGPRVYLHIGDNRHRPAARDFERALENASVDGAKVVVPGIELVKTSPPRSVLRCFSGEECRGEALRIVKLVNDLLVEPQVELQNLSARYGESTTNVRPRHYEIWFAPGNIRLRDKPG
jgi:hypothetical protein